MELGPAAYSLERQQSESMEKRERHQSSHCGYFQDCMIKEEIFKVLVKEDIVEKIEAEGLAENWTSDAILLEATKLLEHIPISKT
ncbi:hypothetical protein Y1Q_0012615 [Alligator mississippiensis]|uniref:Uncharacterized protein n=1 Tax=Alligator mississippiensis TaxID=8496 RepID=A0A151M8A8_ALLMI|nr:hypothetical protein Y1Q_0012615 [Alligator mississippiensis]